MDTRVTLFRLVAAVLASAIALPAASGVLYKSIDANGTIIFSDVPPPSDARFVEQRRIPDSGSSGAPSAVGMPVYEFPEYDAALARANEQVDLAEHAFAISRQGLWSLRDGLRMAGARMTQADEARVEFFKKDVKIARQQLMDLLRERQMASSSRYQLASR